jgi:hypothetical protein
MDTALGGSEDPWSGAGTDALGQATSIGPGEEVVAPPVEAARGPGVVLVPPGEAVRGPGEVLAPALVAGRVAGSEQGTRLRRPRGTAGSYLRQGASRGSGAICGAGRSILSSTGSFRYQISP